MLLTVTGELPLLRKFMNCTADDPTDTVPKVRLPLSKWISRVGLFVIPAPETGIVLTPLVLFEITWTVEL